MKSKIATIILAISLAACILFTACATEVDDEYESTGLKYGSVKRRATAQGNAAEEQQDGQIPGGVIPNMANAFGPENQQRDNSAGSGQVLDGDGQAQDLYNDETDRSTSLQANDAGADSPGANPVNPAAGIPAATPIPGAEGDPPGENKAAATQPAAPAQYAWKIDIEGSDVKSMTDIDFSRFSTSSVTATRTKTTGTVLTNSFSGVLMSTFMKYIAPGGYTSVKFVAEDGYTCVISAGEVTNNYLVANKMDGAILDDHAYPLQVVIDGSLSERWVRKVAKIAVYK